MIYKDIRHNGLGKFRRVAGTDLYVLNQRVQSQLQIWDDQWRRRCEIEQKRNARQQLSNRFESNKEKAARLSTDAQQKIDDVKSILLMGTAREHFRWERLYDTNAFTESPPAVPMRRKELSKPELAIVPELKISFWGMIFPFVRRQQEDAHTRALETAEANFRSAKQAWEEEARKAASNDKRIQEAYKSAVAGWESRRDLFDQSRAARNAEVDDTKERYSRKDRDAVVEFIDAILERSDYPDFFPKTWAIDFVQDSGIAVIDYDLPSPETFPKLKSVKFVQSRSAFEESYLRDSEVAQIYDAAMYQTCLRTLHEVFGSDDAGAISSIVFNGWVNFIDKSNGQPSRSCIMSLQVTKEAFQSINLSAIDPKTCFRSLKGVGSSKLAGMAAVVPILRLDRNDTRFVPSHDVIETIAEATNIAAIPWEEFEYLVRDIFEKEFSSGGGEVKITRASRDHGVDAIAFDPDPIRGGKIVIQAKRYTNLVGVAAVRDLYGTLINEGANKGILVTTAQYGPDSYEFAKGKPITLLDGGNLLSLLDRHGHKARIDLVEAKKLGAAREER